MRIGLVEIVLIQIVLYLLLWITDEFTASLLCVVIPVIFFSVLVIALIAEWIEPSKVPRIFFMTLGVSIVIPIITLISYFMIFGTFGWLEG